MSAKMALQQRELTAATRQKIAADATLDPATGLRSRDTKIGAAGCLAVVDLNPA